MWWSRQAVVSGNDNSDWVSSSRAIKTVDKLQQILARGLIDGSVGTTSLTLPAGAGTSTSIEAV